MYVVRSHITRVRFDWHRRVYVVRSHITGVTICYRHRRVYVVRSQITGGRSGITGGTICYGHRRVYVARSHITAGSICDGHRRVHVVKSHRSSAHQSMLTPSKARVDSTRICPLCPQGMFGSIRSALSQSVVFQPNSRHKDLHLPKVSLAKWKSLCGPRHEAYDL